jgi:hypothetical protein
MKRMIFSLTLCASLLPISSLAQECDSLIFGRNNAEMHLSNGPTGFGAVQFSNEFLYGKLEIIASSPKWLSSIGFETLLSDTTICHDGIIFTDGKLVIFRSFPGLSNECPADPQFKKVLPVPDWETIKETENKYTFIWQENKIDLLVNDVLQVSYDVVFGDSIPSQPMVVTFKTNIDAGLKPAGVIDTVKTNYVCFSYLTTTNVAGQEETIREFSLSQNYPNPFNPETTIRYQLPLSSTVSLTIANILGQKIRTLVSAEQASGEHTILWDGKDDLGGDVASGVYFYRLTAGGFVETRRLLLAR